DAEEIFKPHACDGVALHVKEEVAGVGLWQHREAAARRTWQQFEGVPAGLAGLKLEPGLGRQLCDGFGAHAVDFRGRWQRGQCRKRVDAGRRKLDHLRTTHTSDEKWTVGLAPLALAAAVVVALRA